jgi:hypothetical protein
MKTRENQHLLYLVSVGLRYSIPCGSRKLYEKAKQGLYRKLKKAMKSQKEFDKIIAVWGDTRLKGGGLQCMDNCNGPHDEKDM